MKHDKFSKKFYFSSVEGVVCYVSPLTNVMFTVVTKLTLYFFISNALLCLCYCSFLICILCKAQLNYCGLVRLNLNCIKMYKYCKKIEHFKYKYFDVRFTDPMIVYA